MFILEFRLKIIIYLRFQYVQKLQGYIVLFLQQIDVLYRHIVVATICKDRMCYYQGDIRQGYFSVTQCNFKTPWYFFKSTQYFLKPTQWLDEMKQWLEETSRYLEEPSRQLEEMENLYEAMLNNYQQAYQQYYTLEACYDRL